MPKKRSIADYKYLERCNKKQKLDKNFVLEFVSQDGLALQHVTKGFKNDLQVVQTAVYQNIEAFKFASKELRGDFKFVKRVFSKDVGDICCFCNICENRVDLMEMIDFTNLQYNRDFVKFALRDSPFPFSLNLFPHFRNDEEIVKLACSVNCRSYVHVSDELKNDRQFSIELLRANPFCFIYMNEEIRGEKEIAVPIVRKYPYLWDNLALQLRKDKTLFLELVHNGFGSVSKFFDDNPNLIHDYEFVMTIIVKAPLCFSQLPDILKFDKNIVLEVVKLQPRLFIDTIPEIFREDIDVIVIVAKFDINLLYYIPGKRRIDPIFYRRISTELGEKQIPGFSDDVQQKGFYSTAKSARK